MTRKVTVKGLASAALRDDAKMRAAAVADGAPALSAVSTDSFINFAHKLGVGADNVLTSSTYGFNPITRLRTLLEWIYRGSWLGGQAIDVVADDMTREGVDFKTEMEPEDADQINRRITSTGVWQGVNNTIRWGRLYGGAVCIALIDGQDLRRPLRLEAIGKDQFKGVLSLDRHQIDPDLTDLVTEYGPQLGQPKYYKVNDAAPALRGSTVHFSRVMIRHRGIELPYQQSLTENLWGMSVIERLYDRMISFDSASTGMAQLVHKAHLRTYKVKDLRQIVASGKQALQGLVAQVDYMRRYQTQEGVTMIDMEDEFEVQQLSAMSGVSDAILRLAEQISGALQIPLTRLFGQSPAGLNATGDSDMRNYYDSIKQRQEKDLYEGITTIYKLAARSEGIKVDDDFDIGFHSLWQLKADEKATVAKTNSETIQGAYEGGLINQQTSLRELRQLSRITGVFTNITTEMIDAADDSMGPPMPAPDATEGGTGLLDGDPGEDPDGDVNEEGGAAAGPQKAQKQVGDGEIRRKHVLLRIARRRETSGPDN